MKTLTQTFVIATLLIFTYSINAQNSWVGEYTLGEPNDKQVNGPEIYVPVRINITNEDGKLMAHLYGKSSNIAIDIYANVVENENKISLLYREVGNYHTWKKPFNKNDLLIRLERTNLTAPNDLLTYWGEFRPITEDRVESGKPYFRKLLSNNDDWVRVETKDKKFSVLLPKNFLVYVVKKDGKRGLKVYGSKNGAEMGFSLIPKTEDLSFLAKPSAKTLFGERRIFKVGDFEVFWTKAKFGTKHNDSFIIQHNKGTYMLSVSADTPRKPALRTFISGILLNGKPLVKDMPIPFEVNKRYLISELRTSPEVTEALKQKRVKIKRKITYERQDKPVYGDSPDLFSRSSVTLFFRAYDFRVFVNRPERVYIQMELRADGQVGDMIVYYSGSQKYARRCAKSYSTLKFVPAQVNGRPVNSVRVGVCGQSGLFERVR